MGSHHWSSSTLDRQLLTRLFYHLNIISTGSSQRRAEQDWASGKSKLWFHIVCQIIHSFIILLTHQILHFMCTKNISTLIVTIQSQTGLQLTTIRSVMASSERVYNPWSTMDCRVKAEVLLVSVAPERLCWERRMVQILWWVCIIFFTMSLKLWTLLTHQISHLVY